MKCFIRCLIIATFAIVYTGCDKPTEEDCKNAVENIRRISQTTADEVGADPKAAIRSCRGSSKRETIKCMIAAKTKEDLSKCEGDVGAEFQEQEAEAERKKLEEWEKKQKEEKADE